VARGDQVSAGVAWLGLAWIALIRPSRARLGDRGEDSTLIGSFSSDTHREVAGMLRAMCLSCDWFFVGCLSGVDRNMYRATQRYGCFFRRMPIGN
jgi:hypothetical protein